MRTEPRIVMVYGNPHTVPPRIQRINDPSCPGWQVRYMGTKFFSDGDGSSRQSLREAIDHLEALYKKTPPSTNRVVRKAPLRHKTTNLPPGISGPMWRHEKSRAPYCYFCVTGPKPGGGRIATTVYIGGKSTATPTRMMEKLKLATQLRDKFVKAANSAAKEK